MVACGCAAPSGSQAINDIDILNFALNLEYLEAEFYSWAAFGKGLDPELRGVGGKASVGGKKANLTEPVKSYAMEIAKDEIDHVTFLRAALGKQAVSMPAIDIGKSFVGVAQTAFNDTNLKPDFDPYANDLFFMHGAFIFEDVGVTAYKGAAALIKNKDHLTAAAGILAVEAYHAGIIRVYLASMANVTTPFGTAAAPVYVSDVVGAIAALRSKLSGRSDKTPDDFGIVAPKTGDLDLVPVDMNGIVFSRTSGQVVNIVSFGSPTGKGGFFPSGLNGRLTAGLKPDGTEFASSAAASTASLPLTALLSASFAGAMALLLA